QSDADTRHRRLSRRVASRPAALDHDLRRLVSSDPRALRPAATAQACRCLARAPCHAATGRAGKRTGSADGCETFYRIFAGVPRYALPPGPVAPGAVPHAWRPSRLAGLYVRALG